jgi:hypothetical protein
MPLSVEQIAHLQKIINNGITMDDIEYALNFINKERERCRIKSQKYRETNPKPPTGNPPGRPRKNNKIDSEKNSNSGIPV